MIIKTEHALKRTRTFRGLGTGGRRVLHDVCGFGRATLAAATPAGRSERAHPSVAAALGAGAATNGTCATEEMRDRC